MQEAAELSTWGVSVARDRSEDAPVSTWARARALSRGVARRIVTSCGFLSLPLRAASSCVGERSAQLDVRFEAERRHSRNRNGRFRRRKQEGQFLGLRSRCTAEWKVLEACSVASKLLEPFRAASEGRFEGRAVHREASSSPRLIGLLKLRSSRGNSWFFQGSRLAPPLSGPNLPLERRHQHLQAFSWRIYAKDYQDETLCPRSQPGPAD